MKQHHEPAPFFSPIEWYVMAVVGGITVAMLGVNAKVSGGGAFPPSA